MQNKIRHKLAIVPSAAADRKTVFIVGNGELEEDLSSTIDAAEFVVRFNEPRASIGLSGTRTDLLMLATTCKPMQRRLKDPGFFTSPTFQAAKMVMLAYHPSIIRAYHPKTSLFSQLKGCRSDWTTQTIEHIGAAGKEICILPPQFYKDGCSALGLDEISMHRIFPSTGFLGVYYCLRLFAARQWDIRLCGFSWEGWHGHAWSAERDWINAHAAAGRLSIIGGRQSFQHGGEEYGLHP